MSNIWVLYILLPLYEFCIFRLPTILPHHIKYLFLRVHCYLVGMVSLPILPLTDLAVVPTQALHHKSLHRLFTEDIPCPSAHVPAIHWLPEAYSWSHDSEWQNKRVNQFHLPLLHNGLELATKVHWIIWVLSAQKWPVSIYPLNQQLIVFY